MTIHLSIASPFASIRNDVSRWRADLRFGFERFRIAWRYATNTMKQEDGLRLLYDVEHIAGIYPLETLDRDTVLEAARNRWGDLPELSNLADDAAEYVGSNWDSAGHMASDARDWALEKLAEFAAEIGLDLPDAD